MVRCICFIAGWLVSFAAAGQSPPLYSKLPVGPYPVGFRIVTLIDSSRVSKPALDYLGEKNEADRLKRIRIHLWYPAETGAANPWISYGEYAYNFLLTTSGQELSATQISAQMNERRRSVENWFGKTSDAAWTALTSTTLLAQKNASPISKRFPVLVGMLRSLSTSITNEVLASNGFIVAMISDDHNSSFAESALQDIPSLQQTLLYLGRQDNTDMEQIGAFGFSGSGFIPVLFAMSDYRVRALADIESGLYMDELFQLLSASDHYRPRSLRVPFLHIFSRDLSKQEKYIDEFETKTAFCKRYRLLLNQPGLHHWDFAAEGYTAARLLNNRGRASEAIAASFEIATVYLLHFFTAELKNDSNARAFLSSRPLLPGYPPALWDISTLEARTPAPQTEELEHLIRVKGVRSAIEITRRTLQYDSASNITEDFQLNSLGYTFLNEKKFMEAIGVFQLNTDLHPNDPNLFDSLSEAYELSGAVAERRKAAQAVLSILETKSTLSAGEKNLKQTAERRLK